MSKLLRPWRTTRATTAATGGRVSGKTGVLGTGRVTTTTTTAHPGTTHSHSVSSKTTLAQPGTTHSVSSKIGPNNTTTMGIRVSATIKMGPRGGAFQGQHHDAGGPKVNTMTTQASESSTGLNGWLSSGRQKKLKQRQRPRRPRRPRRKHKQRRSKQRQRPRRKQNQKQRQRPGRKQKQHQRPRRHSVSTLQVPRPPRQQQAHRVKLSPPQQVTAQASASSVKNGGHVLGNQMSFSGVT